MVWVLRLVVILVCWLVGDLYWVWVWGLRFVCGFMFGVFIDVFVVVWGCWLVVLLWFRFVCFLYLYCIEWLGWGWLI